jgi:hypothetical protein
MQNIKNTKENLRAHLQPIRENRGATIIGPANPERYEQNPDVLVPPMTDHGTLSNLRWSFSDSHNHLTPGGWGRHYSGGNSLRPGTKNP